MPSVQVHSDGQHRRHDILIPFVKGSLALLGGGGTVVSLQVHQQRLQRLGQIKLEEGVDDVQLLHAASRTRLGMVASAVTLATLATSASSQCTPTYACRTSTYTATSCHMCVER